MHEVDRGNLAALPVPNGLLGENEAIQEPIERLREFTNRHLVQITRNILRNPRLAIMRAQDEPLGSSRARIQLAGGAGNRT